MINHSYTKGQQAALAHFKCANLGPGCNPLLGGQAATGAAPKPGSPMTPPTSASPPIASGAAKAHALG
jgi:hypothetical protein